MMHVPKGSRWENRLVEVKSGANVVLKCEYDGLNRRTKKHINTGEDQVYDEFRHFFYNADWQILETRKATSENTGPETLQPEYQYVWSLRYIDAPVLRDENTDEDDLCDDETLYYLTDANMNVTCLVDTGGDAVERYVYDPYGNCTVYNSDWSATVAWADSKKNTIRYCGYYFDNETGLHHVRNRVLHPYLGWLNRDRGDDPHVDGMNVYQYVRSQPTNQVDPKGLYGIATHYQATWFHAVLAIVDARYEQQASYVDLPSCVLFAEDIANANWACDDEARNAGRALLERNVENYNLHFPGAAFLPSDFWDLNPVSAGLDANWLVRQMVSEAVEDCNVTWMGEALHALQDSYAHQGKPDLGGHPKREIFEGARWDPATMLLATEIEGDVGGTPKMSGGWWDTRLDDPRYDPHRHADALADTRRALKEFWDACLCTLCYPGASE